MDNITEKFHNSSSSSDSDSDKEKKKSGEASTPSFQAKVSRLFGREKPVHKVLGGGKPADIFLWRNKKVSACVLGGVTVIWVLFELLEYHLLTLICHILMASLATLFAWSSCTKLITKSPPHIPEVQLPEELFLQVASALRVEINGGLNVLRNIAAGKDLKQFLAVIAGLWIMSILGGRYNFLTLFYAAFVLLHTVPVLYEKYEDQVDHYAEKAMFEIKKQYAVFDAKVVSKIPRGPFKDKKIA